MDEGPDDLGPAMLSITGDDDRLRMHGLLGRVTAERAAEGEPIPDPPSYRDKWRRRW